MKNTVLLVLSLSVALSAATPARAQQFYVADELLRLVPPAAGIALGEFGVPARHEFRERFAVMATSGLITVASTYGLKHMVVRERPDGSGFDSFPSGHASIAFWGAEIVREEYGWGWGAGAYAIATGVSALRLYHEKHWATDVLAGAGIGILSARIGYLLLPWERRIFGWDGTSQAMVAPSYNPRAGAVQVTFSKSF